MFHKNLWSPLLLSLCIRELIACTRLKRLQDSSWRVLGLIISVRFLILCYLWSLIISLYSYCHLIFCWLNFSYFFSFTVLWTFGLTKGRDFLLYFSDSFSRTHIHWFIAHFVTFCFQIVKLKLTSWEYLVFQQLLH